VTIDYCEVTSSMQFRQTSGIFFHLLMFDSPFLLHCLYRYALLSVLPMPLPLNSLFQSAQFSVQNIDVVYGSFATLFKISLRELEGPLWLVNRLPNKCCISPEHGQRKKNKFHDFLHGTQPNEKWKSSISVTSAVAYSPSS